MEERKGRREEPYSNVQKLGSRKRRYSEMKHGISAVDLVRWIGRVVNMVPQTDGVKTVICRQERSSKYTQARSERHTREKKNDDLQANSRYRSSSQLVTAWVYNFHSFSLVRPKWSTNGSPNISRALLSGRMNRWVASCNVLGRAFDGLDFASEAVDPETGGKSFNDNSCWIP